MIILRLALAGRGPGHFEQLEYANVLLMQVSTAFSRYPTNQGQLCQGGPYDACEAWLAMCYTTKKNKQYMGLRLVAKQLDAVDCQFEPYPYRRIRLHVGVALVV